VPAMHSNLSAPLVSRFKAGDYRLSGTSTDPTAVIYACTGGPCGVRPCGAGTTTDCPAGVTLLPSFPTTVAAPVAPALPTWGPVSIVFSSNAGRCLPVLSSCEKERCRWPDLLTLLLCSCA
jgi:hypothetical protein